MEGGIVKKDLVYPELSYKIIGIIFEIYNNIGGGYLEKHYHKAMEKEFLENNINFISECPYKVMYKDDVIGRYYMDFLIEDKIVVEIKKGDYFSPKNIKQILGYLKATGHKLGILINFTSSGVKYKRILNIN